MNERNYASNRASIVFALAECFKQIDGTGSFLSVLGNNVHPRLLFWDEVTEFPAVHLAIGPERRVYQGGGFKDRYLSVTVRCYVREEDSSMALERLLQDLETVIEQNGRLAYQDAAGGTQSTVDTTILSIDTDEGVLDPLGVGEILLQVRY
jgi:hypothetical protein